MSGTRRPSTWVRPGTWTALTGEGIWVLAEINDDAALLNNLWQAVSAADANADQVLTQLVSRGFRNLGGFAIAAVQGTSVRLVARHPATAVLSTEGGTQAIAPSASITWTDVSEEIPEQLELATDSNSDATLEFPLALGATGARSVRIDFADGFAVSTPGPTTGAHADRSDTVEEKPGPVIPIAPLAKPDVEPEAETAPDIEPASEPENEPSEPASPYLSLLTDSTADRDALIARLNREDAEEQPVDADRLAVGATAAWNEDLHASPLTEPAEPAPSEAPAPSTLIDGVPGMSGSVLPFPAAPAMPSRSPFAPLAPASPESDPVAASKPTLIPPPEPATDDRTLNRKNLLNALEEPVNAGPTVLAVRCVQGHLSNPLTPGCRVCGTPIPDQSPIEVERPTLGHIVMPNGDSVPLDKNVILGRAPTAVDGGDQHLVTVNTTGEISRKHALITLDGWNVLLRDLNTTNGTYLTLPGQSIVQLRSGEDYLMEPGSEIDLADVLTLRFLVRE